MPKAKFERADVYQQVTDKIIAALEAGVRPWAKPWSSKGVLVNRPLRSNGERYTGINVFLLWSAAADHGFANPYWFTYKQALAIGANVRKGEKSTLVVYGSTFAKKEQDEATGEIKTKTIPFLKTYIVFNGDQIENLPEKYLPQEPVIETPAQKIERIGEVEAFFAATGAEVTHGGDHAFYSPAGDVIRLPEIDRFAGVESYYATLGHETVHWTGHKDRLARDFSGRFGTEAYAAEELVAELGAAFLCADLGLALEPREDHAAYLGNWLKVLKNDKRFIVQAASAAQKACDLLHGFQGAETAPLSTDGEDLELKLEEAA